ncbi:MAG: hypothetical protein LBD20_05890 [Spirochaetaceae bacterium]|jgi:hypothetical protein|nr:hypothetical protein [Spirochaetaceae bacterium]
MNLKNIFKIFLAGCTAFLAINIFCVFYYNIPVHITTKTGVTDYFFEPHAYYSKLTEGFGYGTMNNEGFNNVSDYNAQQIDILLAGSSHMEGMNVPQQMTVVSILNNLFNGSKYVYNIGTSGHDFPHILNNLETAVHYYKPSEYVIIEVGSLQFDMQLLKESIHGELKHLPSYDSTVMFFLQKIPYLRLLYSQYKGFTGKKSDEDRLQQSNSVYTSETYSIILDKVMEKLKRISSEQDIKIIILYHPHLKLNNDGSVYEDTIYEYEKLFSDKCYNNGILFINMSNIFVNAYNTNHILPHGFLNTSAGSGHLNKNGHRLIADELYRQIESEFIEKGDSI